MHLSNIVDYSGDIVIKEENVEHCMETDVTVSVESPDWSLSSSTAPDWSGTYETFSSSTVPDWSGTIQTVSSVLAPDSSETYGTLSSDSAPGWSRTDGNVSSSAAAREGSKRSQAFWNLDSEGDMLAEGSNQVSI